MDEQEHNTFQQQFGATEDMAVSTLCKLVICPVRNLVRPIRPGFTSPSGLIVALKE
jgi:hypothetical protein